MSGVSPRHAGTWVAVIGLVAMSTCASPARPVTYEEARMVVDRRCVECHSEKPINRAFPVAPKAVKLDTPAEMKQHAQRIEVRVAVERTMPIANMSGMTEEERSVLARWVQGGAKIP